MTTLCDLSLRDGHTMKHAPYRVKKEVKLQMSVEGAKRDGWPCALHLLSCLTV